MSSLFSRQCQYALQAVLYLALKREGEWTSIKELTRKLGIPYYFVAKILQDLTRKGMLKSRKGPTGGFALGMEAKDITLLSIVEATDGLRFQTNCVLGFPDCGGEHPCSVHEKWGALRDQITSMLTSRNIASMATKTRKASFQKHADR